MTDARPPERLPCSCSATIKRFGAVWPVHVAEISTSGCLVTGTNLPFKAGDSIRIAIANLEGLPATVATTSQNIVKVDFERPIHPSVAAHLASRA